MGSIVLKKGIICLKSFIKLQTYFMHVLKVHLLMITSKNLAKNKKMIHYKVQTFQWETTMQMLLFKFISNLEIIRNSCKLVHQRCYDKLITNTKKWRFFNTSLWMLPNTNLWWKNCII